MTEPDLLRQDPAPVEVGRYRITIEIFNVAAYSLEDADHLAIMYRDRIRSLEPNDVTIASVRRQG